MIHELLKHPVTRIDYAELDPLLLKLVRQYSTALTRSELSNPKVNVHSVDGRFFILRTPERFDVVFIGVSGATGFAGKPPLLLGVFLLRKTENEP